MDIEKYYKQPKTSSYYQTPLGLFTSLRERFGTDRAPSFAQVKQYLNSQKSHYQHIPPKAARSKIKRGQSARWITRSSVGILHVDVAYLSRYGPSELDLFIIDFRYPTPWKYCLVVVETLSLYVWIHPLKILSAHTCLSGLKKILNDPVMNRIRSRIRRVVSDRGSEFKAGFHQYLIDSNIQHVYTHPGTLNKACFAENAIKNFKIILGRSLSDNRTNVLGKLNNAVYAMNNSTHSQTRPRGISPSDLLIPPNYRTRPGAPKKDCATLIEQTVLHYRRYRNVRNASAIAKGFKYKFQIKDRVRLGIEPIGTFSKISDPQWTTETYEVISIVHTLPIASYKLAFITPDNVKIRLPGSYSETALQRA